MAWRLGGEKLSPYLREAVLATFAEILDGHMRRMRMGAHCLSKEADVPKQTIEGWLKGKRPRDWKIACKIAHTLGLEQSEVDAFLTAAGHPPVAYLIRRVQGEQDYMILSQWIDEAPRQEPVVAAGATQPVVAPTGRERIAGIIPSPEDRASNRGKTVSLRVIAAVVLAGIAALALMAVGAASSLNRPASSTAGVITDQPGGNITSLQFDYDPDYHQGSLRLRICLKSQYGRIRSEEIAPNPRVLVDHMYRVGPECESKYPVIALMVGDVEEVSIGAGDSATIEKMRVYRITRTERGLEGGFIGEIDAAAGDENN